MKRLLCAALALAALFILVTGAEPALAVRLDVVAWGQSDARRSSLHLGGSSLTMGDSGCAVVSVAMIANHFGSTKNPGQLCRALDADGGFDSQGNLDFGHIQAAAGGSIALVGWRSTHFDLLNQELDAGNPVLAQVIFPKNLNNHLVVITGRDGGTYYINDPWRGDTTTINARYGDPATAIRSVVIFHGRHAGVSPPSGQHFSDVPPSSPDFTAIETMADLHVLAGYRQSDGSALFLPAQPLLRAQIAKLLCKAFALKVDKNMTSPFTDLGSDNPSDLYPNNYVAAARKAHIIKGRSRTVFGPWGKVTRAQMVTMVVRAAQSLFPGKLKTAPSAFQGALRSFDAFHAGNMRIVEYNGLLQRVVGFGSHWNPFAPATRAEIAEILYRLKLEL